MTEPRLCSAPKIAGQTGPGTPTFAFKSNFIGLCIQACSIKAETRIFAILEQEAEYGLLIERSCWYRRTGKECSDVDRRTGPAFLAAANDPLEILRFAIGSSALGNVLARLQRKGRGFDPDR
jgi:hypothetical protein